MSAPPIPIASARAPRFRWSHWIPLAACTVLLALALMRPLLATDVSADLSYRTWLYESLRLGHHWGTALVTTDGPLADLQAPGYLSGSVWMAMSWQIAGNRLLAVVLVGAAFRLPWSRRAWALAFLGAILARLPTLAPWLAMVLLFHDLIRRWDREPLAVLPSAVIVGFMALSSIGHLLLGGLGLLMLVASPRPVPAKIVALAGFTLSFLLGWFALGQSLPGLSLWLVLATPLLGHTAPWLRLTDLAPLVPWTVISALVLLIVVVRQGSRSIGRRDFLPGAVFLVGAAWLAWKTIALQPHGLPAVYFGTVLLAAFLWFHQGLRAGWFALLATLALGGAIRYQPLVFTDALGHLNRQAVQNVKLLANLAVLRTTLHDQVKSMRSIHALPRVQAAVGPATIAVLGTTPVRATLNQLNLVSLPAPLDLLVRTRAVARLNAAALESAATPAFVLQGLPASSEPTPALVDAPAQLTLYRHYDLQLEENGLLLWKRKTGAALPAPALVASGELSSGERLRLPAAAGTAYWLELEITPSLPGRLWSWFNELPAAGLVVRDDRGAELRYELSRETAAAGFLVDPWIRGEVDFIRRLGGGTTPRTTDIAFALPPHYSWGWRGHARYRLYALPGLTLTGSLLPSETLQRYRVLSRLPVGAAHVFPFDIFNGDQGTPVLFAHPPSTLEFTVSGVDRRVRGELALLAGSYRKGSLTDGVDFTLEFIGVDGIRRVLFHRWLDPLAEPGDRGPQAFDVTLPASAGGRLLLRTSNDAGRGTAWDWAIWSNVIIE